MLDIGPARKIIIHLNEDTPARHDFLHTEVLSFLQAQGVSGATLIRAAAGFGPHGHIHDIDGAGAAHRHLPVRIEFIETRQRIEALLPSLLELVTDGIIEAHDTTILKIAVREVES